ncbi:MAG: hypothetical protein K5891_00135 [Lachnospiraceae bacterium]|nr:hypothetical protein [Lachnospiraceae bacterium]
MRRGKQYYLITTILFVPAFALAFFLKSIPLGVICAVGVVCNLLMFLRYFKEEQQNARHSNSFRELMRIADSGYLRSYQGFSPTLLDGLEDWEREEAEDFIWDSFQKRGYSDMAPLLPCLKKYDGVEALREKSYSVDPDSPEGKAICSVLSRL